MNKILKLLLIINFLFPILLYSATERRLYKDAASMGMGGVGVSTIGYTFSAIHNPAALGLMSDYDIAPFFSLGVSLNSEMINLLKEIGEVATTKDFTTINYDNLIGKAPNIGVNGPLSAGYMGKGFGIWTTTSADIGMIIHENEDSPLTKAGIRINSLVDAGSKLMNHKGAYTPETVVDALGKDTVNKLLDAYTDDEVKKLVCHVAKKVETEGADYITKVLLPKAKYETTVEITANIGYGYRIPFAALDDISGLSLGATVRFSQRFKLTSGELQPVDKLAESFSTILDNVYQGNSISSDFGMALRIQNWILAMAVRDAFSTGYKWKNLDGKGGMENTKIPYSVDFGTSYRFNFKNPFIQEVGMYLEFQDTTSKYTTWANKLRLGLETKLFNFLDLRIGMYDSFITGGVGLGWKWGRIDFAYYREEYFNYFKSDQYYLNFTIGFDNTPARKAKKIADQQKFDQI